MNPEKFVFGSIVTKSHLRFVRALRQSVTAHHPRVPHYVLLVDSGTTDLPSPHAEEIYVPLETVLSDPVERRHLTFYCDAFELCCALKPLFTRYLFDHLNSEAVVYLDCDMTLHAPLPSACVPNGDASIVLTPHWLTATAADMEAKVLGYGTFNAGYFAVRNDDAGRQFVDFWWERCRRFSAHDLSAGLFVDQAWLNLAPVLFARALSVCRHPGVNVSWWNLHERTFRHKGNNVITTSGEPLVLFHWSQVELSWPGRIFSQRTVVERVRGAETVMTLHELHRRYSDLLKECGPAGDAAPSAYATFVDGQPIFPQDRRLHRQRCAGGFPFFDPFSQSAWFKAQRRKESRHIVAAAWRRRLKAACLRVTGSPTPARVAATILRRTRTWQASATDELRRLLALAKPLKRRTLTDLAAIHGSDKGTLIGERHGYTFIYEGLFAELKPRPRLTLLEIGLRHDFYYADKRRISPSLAMWRDYFPNAEIFGFDINDFSEMAGGRIHVVQGDQGNVDNLAKVADAVDAFDVIIDDGSHASYHQLVTLRTLFPKVRRGGFYIIEDLHWQPPDLEASLPLTPRLTTLLQDSQFLETLGVATHAEILVDGKLGVNRKPAAAEQPHFLLPADHAAICHVRRSGSHAAVTASEARAELPTLALSSMGK